MNPSECTQYTRPEGIMGGPCLHCGRTLAEHMRDAPRHPTDPPPAKKSNFIGAPACFQLEMCCKQISDAFDGDGNFGIYQVGSSLAKADWRDIDLRMIVTDDYFEKLFPDAFLWPDKTGGAWEKDARWCLMTVSISAWLSKQTGLPVDFQIQPQTAANHRHKGPRNAYGLKIINKHTANESEGKQ